MAAIGIGQELVERRAAGSGSRDALIQILLHDREAPRLRIVTQHIELAEDLSGAGLEESFLLQSGEMLEIDAQGARRGDSVPVGRVCIE